MIPQACKTARTLHFHNRRPHYATTNHRLWLHVCHQFSLTPKTHSTCYAISPRPLLTTPMLEPHACIERSVTSRPLYILHTIVHLHDTEMYPRLAGNLLSSASLRNIIYTAKLETLFIPHASWPIYTRHFDNLTGLTPTQIYHVLL